MSVRISYTEAQRTYRFASRTPGHPEVSITVDVEHVTAAPTDRWSGYTGIHGYDPRTNERVSLEVRHPKAPFSESYTIWAWSPTGARPVGWYESLDAAMWNAALSIARP